MARPPYRQRLTRRHPHPPHRLALQYALLPLAPSGVGDCVKVSCLSPLKLLRTLAWKVAGSFLLVVLASCGGGSSNDSGGTTATQLQGLYLSRSIIDGAARDFMGFVIPTSNGNAKWYGWHFFYEDNAGVVGEEANLFTGTLSLGVNGAAQSTNNGILSFTNPVAWKHGIGTIAITQGSLTKYLADLIYLPEARARVQISINATAASNVEYIFNQPATYTSLKGTWTGAWSGKDGRTGATLSFEDAVSNGKPAGTLLNTVTNWDCNVNAAVPLKLSLDSEVRNFFTVAVTLPASCTSSDLGINKPLSGIGIVHFSGANSILNLMLIDDTTGRGIISYRGVK